MHLQIKMDQKSFSLRRLVLKEKCSSFSSIQKPLMVECVRVKTSPTAFVYTHTTTQARINRRKVFVEPMLAVQRVNSVKFLHQYSDQYQALHSIALVITGKCIPPKIQKIPTNIIQKIIINIIKNEYSWIHYQLSCLIQEQVNQWMYIMIYMIIMIALVQIGVNELF
ncbi:Hypothetical_protein [Hexamita inflata]|uniref:Hypothetical_protein n=1 Tax=Hexamita inflata TaxID=28002 RepID=A0ABP1IZR4_9EUKA